MEQNWLLSIAYGLISGFTEFLPVSADAHRTVLLSLSGVPQNTAVLILCRLGVLAALLLSCRPRIEKLRRERRIAAIHPKKRKRQPDMMSLMDIRLLKIMVIPVLLSLAAYLSVGTRGYQLWFLALILMLNGLLLYIPQLLPSGNKDSRSLSALDGLLIGMGGALGVIPGFSRLTGVFSVSMMRGTDRQYTLDMGLLISIPALMLLTILDIYLLLTIPIALSLGLIVACILAALASFSGAYLGIMLMRFLAVRIGFSGFSYYCWGAAMFLFALYLTI